MLGQAADFWDRLQHHWKSFPQRLLAAEQLDVWQSFLTSPPCCLDVHFSVKLRALHRDEPSCPERVKTVLSAISADGCAVSIAAVERMHGKMRAGGGINLLNCSVNAFLKEASAQHKTLGLDVSRPHEERLRTVIRKESAAVRKSKGLQGGGGSPKQVFINEQDSLHKTMLQRRRSLEEMKEVFAGSQKQCCETHGISQLLVIPY